MVDLVSKVGAFLLLAVSHFNRQGGLSQGPTRLGERHRVWPRIMVVPCPRPPTPTLPHKWGGSQTQAFCRLFWSPPPLWGRVRVGGSWHHQKTRSYPNKRREIGENFDRDLLNWLFGQECETLTTRSLLNKGKIRINFRNRPFRRLQNRKRISTTEQRIDDRLERSRNGRVKCPTLFRSWRDLIALRKSFVNKIHRLSISRSFGVESQLFDGESVQRTGLACSVD